jgi:hypothetical protein
MCEASILEAFLSTMGADSLMLVLHTSAILNPYSKRFSDEDSTMDNFRLLGRFVYGGGGVRRQQHQ